MPIANVNAPTGFRLFRSGGKYEPVRRIRQVAADRSKDLMIGDAYTVAVDGTATRVTANTAALAHGVVEGIVLNPLPGSSNGPVSQDYIAAADAGAIIGIEDESAEFVVMMDSFTAATDSGVAIDLEIVDADGNRPLRQSRQSVTKGNAQFRLLGLVDSPTDNAAGAYARVIVRCLGTTQKG